MVEAALNTARQQQEELELKGYNKFHQTQKAGLNQMAVT